MSSARSFFVAAIILKLDSVYPENQFLPENKTDFAFEIAPLFIKRKKRGAVNRTNMEKKNSCLLLLSNTASYRCSCKYFSVISRAASFLDRLVTKQEKSADKIRFAFSDPKFMMHFTISDHCKKEDVNINSLAFAVLAEALFRLSFRYTYWIRSLPGSLSKTDFILEKLFESANTRARRSF